MPTLCTSAFVQIKPRSLFQASANRLLPQCTSNSWIEPIIFPLKPAPPLMFPWLSHKTVIHPSGQPRMPGRVSSSWSAQPLLPLIQSPDRSGICQQLYSLRFRHKPCAPTVAPSLSSLPPDLAPLHQTGLSATQGSGRDDKAAPVMTNTTAQQPPHVCSHT